MSSSEKYQDAPLAETNCAAGCDCIECVVRTGPDSSSKRRIHSPFAKGGAHPLSARLPASLESPEFDEDAGDGPGRQICPRRPGPEAGGTAAARPARRPGSRASPGCVEAWPRCASQHPSSLTPCRPRRPTLKNSTNRQPATDDLGVSMNPFFPKVLIDCIAADRAPTSHEVETIAEKIWRDMKGAPHAPQWHRLAPLDRRHARRAARIAFALKPVTKTA